MDDRVPTKLEMEPWNVIDPNEPKMPDTALVPDKIAAPRYEDAIGVHVLEQTPQERRGYTGKRTVAPNSPEQGTDARSRYNAVKVELSK